MYRRILGPVYDNEKENLRVLANGEIYAIVKKTVSALIDLQLQIYLLPSFRLFSVSMKVCSQGNLRGRSPKGPLATTIAGAILHHFCLEVCLY